MIEELSNISFISISHVIPSSIAQHVQLHKLTQRSTKFILTQQSTKLILIQFLNEKNT